MRPERTLAGQFALALHALILGLSLFIAVFWPRPNTPALMIPVGMAGPDSIYSWARNERARFLEMDPAASRIIVMIPSNYSILKALARGVIPVSTDAASCAQEREGGQK